MSCMNIYNFDPGQASMEMLYTYLDNFENTLLERIS